MKKKTIAQLKRKLWPVFSKYIRQRDNFSCFTCGRKGEGSAIHAGHYIPDSVGGLALKFHEMNVHAQCYNCNINLGGYGAMYHRNMIVKYGQEAVDELWKLKQKITKDFPFEKKIEYYKKLIK